MDDVKMQQSGDNRTAESNVFADSPATVEHVGFQYVWTARIVTRQLLSSDPMILQVSPKFATVHKHVAFQWSLKMRGAVVLPHEEIGSGAESGDDEMPHETNIVALSLYFNDGPAPALVDLRATTGILADQKNDTDVKRLNYVYSETKTIGVVRGKETELLAKERRSFSDYLKSKVGQVVRLSLILAMPEKTFDSTTYLSSQTPTPITSFLTANYRARASSKVFKRRSRKFLPTVQLFYKLYKTDLHGFRSKSSLDSREGMGQRKLSMKEQLNFEETFNKIMDDERDKRCRSRSLARLDQQVDSVGRPGYSTGVFKKLLVATCESCESRARMLEVDAIEAEIRKEQNGDDKMDESDSDENAFECGDQSKVEQHELLANMFFTRVALPEMDYVEDFADFLIDAELNNLTVLKRACEGYLCGELYSKMDLITSLLLDLLFLSIVFSLPVMKSMTLSELSNRCDELSNPEALLAIDEYKSLDRRMVKLSGRNLVELIEEVQRFRQQKLRVQLTKIKYIQLPI